MILLVLAWDNKQGQRSAHIGSKPIPPYCGFISPRVIIDTAAWVSPWAFCAACALYGIKPPSVNGAFFHISLVTEANVSTLGICVSRQSPCEVENKREQHQ